MQLPLCAGALPEDWASMQGEHGCDVDVDCLTSYPTIYLQVCWLRLRSYYYIMLHGWGPEARTDHRCKPALTLLRVSCCHEGQPWSARERAPFLGGAQQHLFGTRPQKMA